MDHDNITEEQEAYNSLLFSVRRSVRYHMRRVRFFDRWHMVTNVFGVLFGTATVTAVLAQWGAVWTISAGLVVAVLSTFDLFVGTSRQSRDHNDLAKCFIELEKSMVQAITPSHKELGAWQAQRLEIEKNEPPVRRTLDVLCHNELMRAMGYPQEDMQQLSWSKKLVAHFL